MVVDRSDSSDLSPSLAGGDEASREVECESVVTMLERERRALTSSLFSLSIFAVAIAFLPNPGVMWFLLAARFVSFLFTRTSAGNLERCIRGGLPLSLARARLAIAMVFTGVTLGLLLWPPPPGQGSTTPQIAIEVAVVITITLVAVTLAALPRSRDAMLAAFAATVAAIILLHPNRIEPELLLVLAVTVTGIRMYSATAGRHIRSAAAMLVENRRLSEDLASALAHAEFLSWRDPLTGLLNRRKLFEDLAQMQGVGKHHVLTVDLDRFKALNDRFGHGAGDHVLIATADAMRALLASLPGGKHEVFRLGGEEFLLILEGLGDDQAAAAAEDLRRRIANVGATLHSYVGVHVTASVGIAEWGDDETLDDVLVRSDLACYEAKGRGRDRVCAAA